MHLYDMEQCIDHICLLRFKKEVKTCKMTNSQLQELIKTCKIFKCWDGIISWVLTELNMNTEADSIVWLKVPMWGSLFKDLDKGISAVNNMWDRNLFRPIRRVFSFGKTWSLETKPVWLRHKILKSLTELSKFSCDTVPNHAFLFER